MAEYHQTDRTIVSVEYDNRTVIIHTDETTALVSREQPRAIHVVERGIQGPPGPLPSLSQSFVAYGGNNNKVSGSGEFIYSGSILYVPSVVATSFTGSLYGTASASVSSSYSVSSSHSERSDYSISSSYAISSSFAKNALTASSGDRFYVRTNLSVSGSAQFSGSLSGINYIDLNLVGNGNTPVYKAGRIFYDQSKGALTVYNDEADISLQVGQENWVRVINKTGLTINDGTPVRISGSTGDQLRIYPAVAEDHTNFHKSYNHIIGVATHDIGPDETGYVTTFGEVTNLNTYKFNAGDELFLQTGSAEFRNTPPPFPYEVVSVGFVGKRSSSPNSNNGFIVVLPREPIHFQDISGLSGSQVMPNGALWVFDSTKKAWYNTNKLPNIIASGSFSGSFSGNGSKLKGIPASSIVGLNLNAITSGSVSASISPNKGLLVNTRVIANSFTGSFKGDGKGLYNIPASGIVGLNLSRISSGSATASIAPNSGFRVNRSIYTTNNLYVTGSAFVKGNVRIEGTASVAVLHTLYQTSSIIYSSGSTRFGNSSDDTHRFFGSVHITGSLTSNSTIKATSFTGSLLGTSSYVNITGLGGVLGKAISGQVAVWNGISQISGSNSLFWNRTNNRLGIGTTSPESALDVRGDIRMGNSTKIGLFSGAGSDQHIDFGNPGVNGITFRTHLNSKPFIFTTGNTERMRISGSGVGIGTSSPTSRLHVVGLGATSATSGLLVQNSSLSNLIEVLNDGDFKVGNSVTRNTRINAGSVSITSIAIGTWDGRATVSEIYSQGIGDTVTITSQKSTAIGHKAAAAADTGIAIGFEARAVEANSFTVGSATGNITNVYFGSGRNRVYGNLSGYTSIGDGVSYTINGSGGNGTNKLGGNITIAGGKGTGTGSAGAIIFSTANPLPSGNTLQSISERMRIHSNGNIGIGITNPSYKISLSGSQYISDNLLVGGGITGSLSADSTFDGNPMIDFYTSIAFSVAL